MARPYPEVGGDDVLVGSVVGDRYHVAGILGQGNTGTVFGVEHIHFGRRAAMKVLRPRSTPADVVHRVFHGDARAAWSVNHACLADVFDVGSLPDGAPFFVSEYLEGETLAKRMTRDRLSLAAAVDVMMQVLAAIAVVHERALLVRDLRPQNIFLVNRRGCRPIVKILDLGLGRLTPLEAVAEQWDADPKGAPVTYPHPFYLSPERTRSEHGIDYASDLFVVGVIFYEMLTGQRPFSASSYNGLLLQIAQANPTPVSELREHSLPDLDEFVEHALSGNPRHRFASAKEMQDELRRIFEGKKKGASATTSTSTSTTIQATPGAPQSGTGQAALPAMGMMPSMAPAAHSLAAIPQIPGTLAAPLSPIGLPPLAPPQPPPLSAPAPQARSRQSPLASTMGPSGLNSRAAVVSSVNPIASVLEPESPRDQTLNQELETRTNTDLPNLGDEADLYADETETDRKFFDLHGIPGPTSSSRHPQSSSRMAASSSRMPPSRPNSAGRFDEASAEAPHRTVPPQQLQHDADALGQPPTVQAFKPMSLGGRPPASDDFSEEPTESRSALSDEVLRNIRDANKTPLPPVPEEETQQLEMTPELRAKIEAQYAARPMPPPRAPMQSEMDSIPPPTKRLDK